MAALPVLGLVLEARATLSSIASTTERSVENLGSSRGQLPCPLAFAPTAREFRVGLSFHHRSLRQPACGACLQRLRGLNNSICSEPTAAAINFLQNSEPFCSQSKDLIFALAAYTSLVTGVVFPVLREDWMRPRISCAAGPRIRNMPHPKPSFEADWWG